MKNNFINQKLLKHHKLLSYNMVQTQRSLSYQYDEFMKYQQINNVLPQHLVPYCVQDASHHMPNISTFDDQLSSIISSITKGDNPNNVVFKNFVKFYVNMINQGNFDEYLQKLRALDYSSREHIHFLGSELIICAIRCPISVKGFTFQEESKYKSVPEICADMAKQFSSLLVKSENVGADFHAEIMKICQQYFLDFVDLNKSLDENNENTSDNFKGFMTFLGLLYSRGIINIKVVIDCLDSIKRSIFCTECKCQQHCESNAKNKHNCPTHSDKLSGYKKSLDNKISNIICYNDCNECETPTEATPLVTYRKHIECINLHKGYEHLLVHVTHSLDSRISELIANYNEKKNSSDEKSKEQCNSILSAMEKLHEYLSIIMNSHQEIIQLNKCYKSMNKNQLVAPLRPYVIITHNSLGNGLNKLNDKTVGFLKGKL